MQPAQSNRQIMLAIRVPCNAGIASATTGLDGVPRSGSRGNFNRFPSSWGFSLCPSLPGDFRRPTFLRQRLVSKEDAFIIRKLD